MKIVLDTNVLVSGLLNSYHAPGEIVRMTSSGALLLCYDARILGEYREVLSRPKFKFDTTFVEPFLDYIQSEGLLVAAVPLKQPLPDPSDEMFLEVALAGNARCLVTGNLKDFPVSKRQGMAVVSPGEMITLYREGSK